MNKKGFTLVELLATIVVLGIISVIAMVSVDKMIDHSQIKECENILLSIKTAAKEYVSYYRFDKTKADLEKIEVSDLIDAGFLTSEIKDPFTKGDVDGSNLELFVTLNDDYTYKDSVIKNNSSKAITCSEQVESGFVRFPG